MINTFGSIKKESKEIQEFLIKETKKNKDKKNLKGYFQDLEKLIGDDGTVETYIIASLLYDILYKIYYNTTGKLSIKLIYNLFKIRLSKHMQSYIDDYNKLYDELKNENEILKVISKCLLSPPVLTTTDELFTLKYGDDTIGLILTINRESKKPDYTFIFNIDDETIESGSIPLEDLNIIYSEENTTEKLHLVMYYMQLNDEVTSPFILKQLADDFADQLSSELNIVVNN